jgi:5-methylcytosine-specific restriction enzyme subunit McrC
VDESTGQSRFRDFLREEQAMRRLFEAFVKNFYLIEQSVFRVSSPKIEWQATFTDETVRSYLPEMRTDVCLRKPGRMIIIDCKFYREALQYYYGKPTFNSAHLYQMNAYLKNLESEPDGAQCEGILLYPAVNYPLNMSFDLQGHPVRIRALNLDQDWQSIKANLLNLIQS